MTHALTVVTVLALTAGSAAASLTLTSGLGCDRTQNLVVNGSFEDGAPAPDGARYYWATGTANTPFAVPGGWQSSGATETYATWGNDGVGPATINGSDVFPDGRNGLYFGNLFTSINMTPTFHGNGTVTFPGNPIFTPDYGAPARLWQTVPTNASLASSFKMSFWVSGEAAQQNVWTDGIFGFKMTNVLPGDPIQYLTSPGGTSALGQSHLFEYTFSPINPLLPVTVEFINWGHWKNLSSAGFNTELVLDDVIINAVPAPGMMGIAGAALGMLARRRR